jgi:Ser/Thr protein kinase RdoA (MazF antagonist)
MTSRPPAPSGDDLRRDYGLDVSVFECHEGGFESDCWVVDRTWFVKLWRGEPPERLSLLERLRGWSLPVVEALRTSGGELSSVSGGRPYAVFPYVRGRTAGDDDWAETARAMKHVHEITEVALPRTTMQEPCIDDLRARLDHPWIRDRRREVASQVDRLERVIERAGSTDAPHVLCHQDFGRLNLLIDQDVVAAILDWEQACLAPREHDVWVAAEGPHGREFLRNTALRTSI